MCDTDSVKTVTWDTLGIDKSPPSLPSAPKGGHPTRKLKPRKPRSPDKIISTALHIERKHLADIENHYNRTRFRSLAFINFITVFQVSRHLPSLKSYQQLSVLFNDVYQPGQLITLQQINSLDDSKLEWDGPRDDKPPTGINYDLFPNAVPLHLIEEEMEPQSGMLPSPSLVFEECQKSVNASLHQYVAQFPQLERLLTAPTYALLLGCALVVFILHRICRDLVLSFKFAVGVVTGYLLQKHSDSLKYAPQSSKAEKLKAQKALRKARKEEKRLKHLRWLSSEAGRKFKPQSGLESDDGAKFLGKTTPKFGSSPDKPATTGAPGVSSVSNTGRHMQVLPRVAQPKQISKKDPNDGFLSGFGVGI